MKFKFKYKIKIFKRNFIFKKNTLNCTLFYNNNLNNVYLLNLNIFKKLFLKKFFKIIFLNLILFVYLKKIHFYNINNKIKHLEFVQIKKKVPIFYQCKFSNILNNFLYLKNIEKIPRKLILNICFLKKVIKDKDFLMKKFEIKNKILFYTK